MTVSEETKTGNTNDSSLRDVLLKHSKKISKATDHITWLFRLPRFFCFIIIKYHSKKAIKKIKKGFTSKLTYTGSFERWCNNKWFLQWCSRLDKLHSSHEYLLHTANTSSQDRAAALDRLQDCGQGQFPPPNTEENWLFSSLSQQGLLVTLMNSVVAGAQEFSNHFQLLARATRLDLASEVL